MRNKLKQLVATSKSPSIFEVFIGALLGMVITYVLLNAGEILSGDHYLNFELMSNLVWLGVGVMIFGFWEASRANR